MSVYIDGRYYYSPCEKCRENSCYSCTLRKYQEDLQSEREKRTSAEWRIERELEPRIKAEERAYDFWVSEDTGAEACECFSSLIDEMIDYVKTNYGFKHVYTSTAGCTISVHCGANTLGILYIDKKQ